MKHWKNTVAVALVSAMTLASPALAATPAAQTEERTVYTFEQVLEKATKNNSDLSLLEQNLDLMSRQSDNLNQTLGGEIYPSDPGYDVTPQYETLRQLNNLMVQRQTSRYKKEALQKQLEYSVMTAMTTIITNEANLAMADSQLKLYEDQARLINTKKTLGMATELEVNQAEAQIQQYKTDMAKAQSDVEQAYANLARLMGISDTNFSVVYEPEYEPFMLNTDLNTYLAAKNQTNPTLEGARLGAETLERNKSFDLANSTALYTWDQLEYNISQANANVKNAEDSYTKMGEATYATVQQLEGTIAMLGTNLDLAESNLKVAQLNLQNGSGTQLDVDQAQNKVDTTKNALQEAKLNHANAVYLLENPCAAGSGQ